MQRLHERRFGFRSETVYFYKSCFHNSVEFTFLGFRLIIGRKQYTFSSVPRVELNISRIKVCKEQGDITYISILTFKSFRKVFKHLESLKN